MGMDQFTLLWRNQNSFSIGESRLWNMKTFNRSLDIMNLFSGCNIDII